MKEADFLWLLNQSGLTKGNLSAHLAKLEQAGYVAVKKEFEGKTPRSSYRLTASGDKELQRYRATMRRALG